MANRASVEPVTYGGWSHNLRLSNDTVEVVVTLDVGPRIIRYARVGGENALHERPAELGKSGEPVWVLRGGHRLWVSPEDPKRTYALDNEAVQHQVEGGRVRVWNRPDASGLEKTVELELAATGSALKVTHRIRNAGAAPTELSVWALTVLPPGGQAFVPLAPHREHPGDPDPTRNYWPTPADYGPGQLVAVWPYTHLDDPRIRFGSSLLRLRQVAGAQPAKLGLGPAIGGPSLKPVDGLAAYVRNGIVFGKRFETVADASYPDGGCAFETYTDTEILELESLSPLVTLAPRAEAIHVEHWCIEDARTSGFPGEDASDDALSSYFRRFFGRGSEKIG